MSHHHSGTSVWSKQSCSLRTGHWAIESERLACFHINWCLQIIKVHSELSFGQRKLADVFQVQKYSKHAYIIFGCCTCHSIHHLDSLSRLIFCLAMRQGQSWKAAVCGSWIMNAVWTQKRLVSQHPKTQWFGKRKHLPKWPVVPEGAFLDPKRPFATDSNGALGQVTTHRFLGLWLLQPQEAGAEASHLGDSDLSQNNIKSKCDHRAKTMLWTVYEHQEMWTDLLNIYSASELCKQSISETHIPTWPVLQKTIIYSNCLQTVRTTPQVFLFPNQTRHLPFLGPGPLLA